MKTIFLVFLFALIFLVGCAPKGGVKSESAGLDTVQSLSTFNAEKFESLRDSVKIFKSNSGTTHKVTFSAEESSSSSQLDCVTDDYHGNDRAKSKTSLYVGELEPFTGLDSLYSSLPSDEQMRAMNPPISKDASSDRVEAEKHNVALSNVFIYCLKREPDNDYHIIIGSKDQQYFFNVECTGLPDSSNKDFDALQQVREEVKTYFKDYCSSKYLIFDPPIAVKVSGSIFYDIDHAPGVVGPQNYKPKTAWEIHPLSNIEFIQN